MDLHTTICMEMYSKNDRDLANILHRLESLLYRESLEHEILKEIHGVFRELKVSNKTTKGRAKSFMYAIEAIDDFMDAHYMNEYKDYIMERVYSLLT